MSKPENDAYKLNQLNPLEPSPDWVEVKEQISTDELSQGHGLVMRSRNRSIYQLRITNAEEEVWAMFRHLKLLQTGKLSKFDEAVISRVLIHGSCESLSPEGVVGGIDGMFMLGRCAWFGVSSNNEIRTFVTYPLDSIFHVPAVNEP